MYSLTILLDRMAYDTLALSCAGVAAFVMLASLPSLHWRCLHLGCRLHPTWLSTCVVELVLLASSIVLGIITLVALALLSLLCWHCFPHHAGIFAFVMMQASLPLLCWHCALAPSPLLRWCHCPFCPGIVTPPVNVLGLSIEEKDILFCVHVG